MKKYKLTNQIMKKYKLTNQNLQTYNGFQWEIGKKVTTEGNSNDQWLHYYDHPLLAVLFNRIHANIDKPKLFVVEASGKHLNDNGLKGGCTEMRLIKEISLPVITTNQRIAFGIYCALEVCKDKDFIKWANNWLKDIDRTSENASSAYSAYSAASSSSSAYSAAYSAAYAAAYATNVKSINLIKLVEKSLKIINP